MKRTILVLLALISFYPSFTQSTSVEEQNKALARGFYDDLWFSNNTDNYVKYMADTYIAHDIGDREGVVEQAIEQKNIADFFWENGDWHCTYDYQIAEGDLVATRWIARYEPKTLFGKIVLGKHEIPIINVFRFKDGKIVELWNHRHDIDGPMTKRFTLQGLAIGLLIALIPTFFAFRYRRKLKQLSA